MPSVASVEVSLTDVGTGFPPYLVHYNSRVQRGDRYTHTHTHHGHVFQCTVYAYGCANTRLIAFFQVDPAQKPASLTQG